MGRWNGGPSGFDGGLKLKYPLLTELCDGLNYINKTGNKASQNDLRNIWNKRGLKSGTNLKGRSDKIKETNSKK